MNYLKQINALYDQMETNPLSANAQSLWHCLMQVNNKARWKKNFTVSLGLLCAKTSIAESTLRRARKELQEKGYIRYQSQKGNLAAMYEIVVLYQEETAGQSIYAKSGRKTQSSEEALAMEEKSKAVQYAKQHIPLRKEDIESIIKWEKEFDTKLVMKAIDIAVTRGNSSWNYIRGILQRWKQQGIHQNYRAKLSRNIHSNTREVVPPWFIEYKKQENLKEEKQKRQQPTPEELEIHLDKLKKEYFALCKNRA